MNWIPVVLAVYTIATPQPLKNAKHVTAFLPPGATAKISERGNNVPCWTTTEALTAFMRAYQTGDRDTIALQVAQNSVLLATGDRVRGLATLGYLGLVTRLKVLDGDRAGTVCYESSALNIYTAVHRTKH